MKRTFTTLVLGLAIAGSMCTVAFAADTDTANVSFEIQAINELAISGDPAALVVSQANAGQAPQEATDSSTSYAISTNETGKRITAKIDLDMPNGVDLSMNLTAPTSGTSQGDVSLTTMDQDVVTGISKLNESNKAITYRLSATSAAGVVPSDTRIVTLTIADGAI